MVRTFAASAPGNNFGDAFLGPWLGPLLGQGDIALQLHTEPYVTSFLCYQPSLKRLSPRALSRPQAEANNVSVILRYLPCWSRLACHNAYGWYTIKL